MVCEIRDNKTSNKSMGLGFILWYKSSHYEVINELYKAMFMALEFFEILII